jgi:cysteinyl-tRNA synthetase
MHNGFLQVEGEKMAKSAGNFVTIRELLADWPGEVIRLNMLRTHYRQPMDWTIRGLEENASILANWRSRLLNSHMSFKEQNRSDYQNHEPSSKFFEALADDLNTPAAISEIHRLSKDGSVGGAEQWYASMVLLGVTSFDDMANTQAIEHSDTQVTSVSRSIVESRIAERNAARKAKDFQKADRIRDELLALGVELHDAKDGTTTWKPATSSLATGVGKKKVIH